MADQQQQVNPAHAATYALAWLQTRRLERTLVELAEGQEGSDDG